MGAACPGDAELGRFAAGDLPASDRLRILEHADGCSVCYGLLAGVLASTLQGGEGQPRPAAPLGQGDTIGRYTVLHRLGAGGMGVVYAAYDAKLDRKVAIKLLHPRGGNDDAQDRARLEREARALARLTDPHVVAVHDVGEHDGRVFLAMEYVEGQTLGRWLKDAEPSWREVVDVFASAAQGLIAAHACGLVHRDFKPDNVMLGGSGRVQVMDFGLARQTETNVETSVDDDGAPVDGLVTLTATGTVAGTPAYMAPEQFSGRSVDARADQYSFCVALYEALYGARPYRATTPSALLVAALAGTLPDPPSGTAVPGWVRAVVARGLKPEPDDRFADMRALASALADDPTRRRRAWLAVAGVATAGVAVLGWQASQRAASARACDEAASEIATVWSPSARARLRAAFEGTGVGFASDVGAQVTGSLDAVAEDWREQRRAACALEPSRQARARADCLAGVAAEVSALVEVFGEPTAKMLTRAPIAVSRLPRPSICADDTANAARAAAWRGAAASEDALANRRTLASARAWLSVARPEQALERADAALAAAVASESSPLHASALVLRGRALWRLGKLEPATVALRDAYALGVGAGADEVTVRAATSLCSVVGDALGQAELGGWWCRVADNTLIRQGTDPGFAYVDMLAARAGVELTAGRPDAAAQSAAEGLTKLRSAGASKLLWVPLLSTLGSARQGESRFADAVAALEEALQIVEASSGPRHPNAGLLLLNMGAVHAEADDLATATELSARGLSILEAWLGPTHVDVARGRINLGNLQRRAGDYDAALPTLTRAVADLRGAVGDAHPSLGAAMLNLGLLHSELDDRPSAVVAISDAVAIFERGSRPPELLARARFSLAKNLPAAERVRARGLADKALDVFSAAPGSSESVADVERWLLDNPAAPE